MIFRGAPLLIYAPLAARALVGSGTPKRDTGGARQKIARIAGRAVRVRLSRGLRDARFAGLPGLGSLTLVGYARPRPDDQVIARVALITGLIRDPQRLPETRRAAGAARCFLAGIRSARSICLHKFVARFAGETIIRVRSEKNGLTCLAELLLAMILVAGVVL